MSISKNIVLFFSLVLCGFCLLMSLMVFLTRSPQSQAEYYLNLSNHYQNMAQDDFLTDHSSLYMLQKAYDFIEQAENLTPFNIHLHHNKNALSRKMDQIRNLQRSTFLVRKQDFLLQPVSYDIEQSNHGTFF